MSACLFEPTEELCRRYTEEGYVTFEAASSNSTNINAPSFLEVVAGVTTEEAQNHLTDCVLLGKYDLNTSLRPTKVPPQAYVKDLLPLVPTQATNERKQEKTTKFGESEEITVNDGISDETPWSSKTRSAINESRGGSPSLPKSKGSCKPRRTVHAIDVHLCDSVFNRIATSPLIGELVGKLTGWANEGVGVRLLETQVWMKPPMCTIPLAFHRDTPYFGFLAPLDVCTVWFTFDSIATVEEAKQLGGLEYAVGSHRWSQEGGIEGVFFDKDYRSPMKKAAAEHSRLASTTPSSYSNSPTIPTSSATATSTSQCPSPIDIHYVTAKAGGASIHNGMLWHGSGANMSDRLWRRGMGIHYTRADACFKPEFTVYDDMVCDEKVPTSTTASAADPKKPFLSAMWAPHKQRGSLRLNDGRFPVIWSPTPNL